jgi:hypothetical protein
MNTKYHRNTHDLKLQAGFRKRGKGLVFNVAGKKYTSADVLRLLQGRIDAADQTATAKAAFHAAVAAERDEVGRSEPTLDAVRQILLILLAASPEALADFGLVPRKTRRELTVKEKSAAVDQAIATREARHTMGARQKRKVTGSASKAVAPVAVATEPAGTSNGAPAGSNGA